MLSEKEALFQQFHQLTLHAVESQDPEQLTNCLEQRESIITKINELDQASGKIETNDSIRGLIEQIQQLDRKLNEQIHQFKEEAMVKLRAAKNSRKMQDQYQQRYTQSDGVFYDKRK